MWRRIGASLLRRSPPRYNLARAAAQHSYLSKVVDAHPEGDHPDLRWVPFALAALSTSAHAEEARQQEEGSWNLLSLTARRRVFFKYEKRIRDLSPQDKVFDYFASVTHEDGARFMTPADLLSSLVACYPPESSLMERSGGLQGERKQSGRQADTLKGSDFFKSFDTDGDGVISFSEYRLILMLLAIPLEDVKTVFSMFDEDDSGAISQQEFAQVTGALRQRLRRVPRVSRTGTKLDVGEESPGMMVAFFGEDGTRQLDLQHFTSFVAALHAELVRLEFSHYDPQHKGAISGTSFAHSLVSHVKLPRMDHFLSRVDALPEHLRSASVSAEDFRQFAQLRQLVHKLGAALDFHASITSVIGRRELQRAVTVVAGRPLPEHVVDILFALYGSDEGQGLDYRELMDAMQRREGYMVCKGAQQPMERQGRADTETLFGCLKACFAS